MNVLLVDSDQDTGASLRRALESAGHRFDLTLGCVQALDCVSFAHHDAVILAPGAADADGLALCAKLRRMSPALPILMIAASDDVADRLAGFTAGADDVLPKPFDVEELLARLAAVQRRRPAKPTMFAAVPSHMIVIDRASPATRHSSFAVRLTDRQRQLFGLVLDAPSGTRSLSTALLRSFDLDLGGRDMRPDAATRPSFRQQLASLRDIKHLVALAGARLGRRRASSAR